MKALTAQGRVARQRSVRAVNPSSHYSHSPRARQVFPYGFGSRNDFSFQFPIYDLEFLRRELFAPLLGNGMSFLSSRHFLIPIPFVDGF